MGSKRNKIKKMLSPANSPPPPSVSPEDDDLMDDLFAQLDSKDQTVQAESATVISEMQLNQTVNLDSSGKQDSKARHRARQARKAAALAEQYAPNDAEADARIERETAEEKRIISATCDELGLQIHEITPDGHCLFSAIADQLQLLGLVPHGSVDYITVRRVAADYIYDHPDDFIPFLPSSAGEDGAGATSSGFMSQKEFEVYCKSIRDTGVWGGEPEILALSRAYRIPIHVIQGSQPPIVEHNPTDIAPPKDSPVVRISYHRRMYGLGEHYNSLRPKSGLSSTLKSLLHSNLPTIA
ncbi:hypothetical protein BXZ70DRAFT_1003623 [Cristinia sonorae]|uniref:OTU domain-containing protein n=1 Tax=Cristinia sonorae TaxID=1940300 RepID=A0A8K0UWG8_9AGAR|nr:hypothetical protein BXZ70DRAFT_1003623 [Cristinia sonorae]